MQSPDLPHDLNSERALLGCILKDRRVYDKVAATVTWTDFFDRFHSLVFRAMGELSEAGVGPEVIAVNDWLRKNAPADLQRDAIDLLDGVYISTNHSLCAKVVKDCARRRHLIESLSAICKDAATGDDPEQLCGRTEMAVATNRSKTPSCEQYLFEQAEEMAKPAEGVKTGFWELDNRIVCLENGSLIIVGGFTGMGKSAFGYALARNSVIQGNKAAIFDLEMTAKQRAHRVMSSETGIPLHRLRVGDLNELERDVCIQSLYRIPIMFFHSWNGKPSFVRGQLSRIDRRDRPNLIVIDYLGFMQSDSRQERHDLMIGSITKALKRLAGEMNIPVVLLSQFARVKEDREPMLSDLRGSGDIEQDADVVLFVHRHKETPLVADIIIAKGRQDGTGRVQIPFYKEYASFNKPQEVTQVELPIGTRNG